MEKRSSWAQGSALRMNTLMISGLIAFCLLLVPQIFSLPSLDLAALISIIAFALGLPMLVTFVVASHLQQMGVRQVLTEQKEVFTYHQFQRLLPPLEMSLTRVYRFATIGVYLTLGGITAALWHISWIVAVLFVASSSISYFVFIFYTMQCMDGNTSEPTPFREPSQSQE